MKNTKKPISEALQKLSLACDLIGINYPTLEVDARFVTALHDENPDVRLTLHEYTQYYGIEFKIRKV